MVLIDSACIDQWINLGWIRFLIGQAIGINMGFYDCTDEKDMAAEIKRMNHTALKVYGALLNQWDRIQLAVFDTENLRFIDSMPGIDAAIINFFDNARRRYIYRKGTMF